MELESSTESKPNVRRRIPSIFKPDSVPLNNTSDNQYPPEYKQKLVEENASWDEETAKAYKEYKEAKKLLQQSVPETVDKNILDVEQQQFLAGAIDYNAYLKEAEKFTNYVKIVTHMHNDFNEVLENANVNERIEETEKIIKNALEHNEN